MTTNATPVCDPVPDCQTEARAPIAPILDPAVVKIEQDAASGRLLLRRPSGEATPIERVHLPFPLTSGNRFVLLRGPEGKDVGILEDYYLLDQASQAALKDALDEAYFIPQVRTVYSIAEQFDVLNWDVETDRGRRRFEVRGRHNVRPLDGRRILIKDVDGNRYEIPDFERLDARSRDMVEEEL